MNSIEIDSLSKTYNSGTEEAVQALEDVNLTAEVGEFLSIVGPSGCGKSTLLSIIAGLVEKSSGSVQIGDEEVTEPRAEVGVVFQDPSLYPWRTILRNAEFGLEVMGVEKEERRDRVRDILELVGLDGFGDAYPEELSGGMKQRVSLARTLAADPDILLMDEPFGALDEQTRTFMGEELLDIWGETNKTVVFITHSLQEAILLSDRVAVMSHRPGRIVNDFTIPIERPRESDVIGSDKFGELQTEIWSIVKEESQQSLQAQ